jgi:hypothetical protein
MFAGGEEMARGAGELKIASAIHDITAGKAAWLA